MIFNRNNKKEQPVRSSNEFDKQILRINTLEVQIKKLLEFEKQLRASMHGTAKGEKDGSLRNEQKNSAGKKSYQDDGIVQKVHELSRRIEKLEKTVQGISSRQYDNRNYSLSHEKGSIEENQLLRIVEQMVSEKLAAQHNKIQQQDNKIRSLEQLVSQLMNRESSQFSRSIGKDSYQTDREWETSIHLPQEESDSLRVLALERNLILVNEVQASLIKRVDELGEKHSELIKKCEETEVAALQQNPVYHIDKLYLDKYEQNNNIAQIGIRELSGALNIGATYGKDVIPKKITEEAKAEIEKMKAAMGEMDKQQTNTDESDKPQPDESSLDITSIHLEEEESFTDIDIE